MSPGRKVAASILVLIGLIAIAVGVVYFVVKASSLPAFFPGHVAVGLPGANSHGKKRGLAAVVVGVVLLLVAVGIVYWRPGRRRRQW